MVGLVVIADRLVLFLLPKYWSYCYCRMIGLAVIADHLAVPLVFFSFYSQISTSTDIQRKHKLLK
jgi:hypothetical protein